MLGLSLPLLQLESRLSSPIFAASRAGLKLSRALFEHLITPGNRA